MSNNITKQLYENIYRALGGDPNAQFETAEDVWNAVTDIYDEGYDPIDLSPLDVSVTRNGTLEFTAPDNDGYNKVTVNVEVPTTSGDGGYDFTEYGFSESENTLAQVYLNNSLDLSKYPTDGSASFDVPKGQMIIGPKVNLINEWWMSTFTDEFAVMYIPTIVNTNCTSMNSAFRGCSNLIALPDILSPDGGLGTNIVTDMTDMFKGCSKIKHVPAMDTSNATNMNNMFEDCIELRSIPDFNTSNVISASCLFKNCVKLGTVPNNMDFKNCIDMSYMFSNCGNFGFDPETFEEIATPTVIQTSEQLVNINGMFENLWGIKYLPEMNTSGVTSAIRAFFGCGAVTEIPQYNFGNLQRADNLFSGCSCLTTIPQFDFSNLISANGIFDLCNSLTSLPQFNFMNLQGGFYMNSGNYEFSGEGYTALTDIGGFLYGHTEGANYLDLKDLTALTTDSITNVVNCVADRSSMSPGMIVFDSKLSGNITEEHYSTATAKNWIVILNEWVSPQ